MNQTEENKTEQKLAVILVRGLARITQPIRDTLIMLNLTRKNHAVVIEATPANIGMITKVKDFVTWGEINEQTMKELLAKRGEETPEIMDRHKLYHYGTLKLGGKYYKRYFRLNPPKKGFGRKGIKVAFAAKGALGYRGEKINDLIMRMV